MCLRTNVLGFQCGVRANVLACQGGLRANVPTCQHVKSEPTSHFYVPTCQKMCQRFNLAFQRTKRRANFSTSRANVPKSAPIIQTFLLQNANGNVYTLLLYEKFYIILDIIFIHIMGICIVQINCIILYSLKLFCSLYRDENIKRPGFCTSLQVTRVFSNFRQLKQLNKIKNTCKYYDLLEL